MSYKLLKYNSWSFHLINYIVHSKSKKIKFRTIHPAQCPHLIVVEIVRNLTFFLIENKTQNPKSTSPLIKNQTKKLKNLLPSISTGRMEEKSSGREPVRYHTSNHTVLAEFLPV